MNRYSDKSARGERVLKQVLSLNEQHGIRVTNIFISNSSSEYQLY